VTRHAVFSLLLVLAVVATLGSCGKKGDPTLPKGQKDSYPSNYPKSDDPQTGVFSG
jgi:predicted small lipoprotein YifL